MNFIRRHLYKHQLNRAATAAGLHLDARRNAPGWPIFRDIFIERRYALGFPFHRCATVVDVGAHFGYFSLFAAKNSADGSRILSIEPGSANFTLLQQNFADNPQPHRRAVRAALSGQSGTGTLRLAASYNHSFHSGALNTGTRTEEVPLRTLTDLLDEAGMATVDFLKLDCEGAEYDILFNCPNDTLARIDTISLEFHDVGSAAHSGDRLYTFFRDRGYQVLDFSYHASRLNLNYGSLVVRR